MTKVSVIVPVYNGETYIRECITSVINQTFSDWELLLIDDGSSDKTYEICCGFSNTDTRIKAIRKQNGGVSSARNLGLDLSAGEFIIFLDADDYWIDDSFLQKMVAAAEAEQLDIIRGEYKAVTEEGQELFDREGKGRGLSIANKPIDSAAFIKDAIAGEFFLPLSLFRKPAIASLRLNEDQIFLEDMRFYSLLLMQPLRCMYVPLCFYAYRKNTCSASFKIDPKKLADSFSMCDFFHECAQKTSDEGLKSYYNHYSVMMYKWTLETVSMDGYYKDREALIDTLGLDAIRQRVLEWIGSERIEVRRFYFTVRPITGVRVFRVTSWIKGRVYKVRKRIADLIRK